MSVCSEHAHDLWSKTGCLCTLKGEGKLVEWGGVGQGGVGREGAEALGGTPIEENVNPVLVKLRLQLLR